MTSATLIARHNVRQAVYRLSVPFKFEKYSDEDGDYVAAETSYVFVSHAIPGFGHPREVLIFACCPEGEHDWREIGGSYDEPDGHTSALARMGYVIHPWSCGG